MLRARQILFTLVLVLNVLQSSASCDQEAALNPNNLTEVETTTSTQTNSENDSIESATAASRARSMEEFFFDMFAKSVKKNLHEKNDNNPVDSFIQNFIPKAPTATATTTTTTTTTTESPMEDLAKTLVSIPVKVMPHPKALDVPAKAINKAIKKSIVRADNIQQSLFGGKHHDKVIDSWTGLGLTTKVELEPTFKDETQIEETEYMRQPKYISKQCNFRVACEIGRLLKPATPSLVKPILESSKFLQDLQNRYTRATTYGLVKGNCTRYYCVFVRLLGGPTEFSRGVTDLINRTMNPELYE